MAQQIINVGTQPNDKTGDPLRTAFEKVNDNFTELYNGGGGGGGFNGGTITNPLTITSDAVDGEGALNLTGLPISTASTTGLLQVGPPLTFSDTDIMGALVHDVDSYAQLILQNVNSGATASTDFVVSNDTPGTNVYGDYGINSSMFVSDGSPFSDPNGTYLYSLGGSLAIGAQSANNVSISTDDTPRITVSSTGPVSFSSSSPVTINSVQGATSHDTGALVIEGGLGVGGNIVANNAIYVGSGAASTNLANPTIIAKQAGTEYIQGALVNSSATGSADWVAYASNGTSEHGWIDMGFTGANFNDPTYTITHPGEGYIFVAGVDDGLSHGSLVLCTHDTGTENDIVFATGGFLAANEKMRLYDSESQLHIEMSTISTSTTTGALRVDGGVGIAGSLYASALYDNGNRVLTSATPINYVGDYKESVQTTDHGPWLLLEASTNRLVSRTTYAALFALIGTTYGAGDGSNFGLPSITQSNNNNFMCTITA
jgi:hypothetical protein